MLIALGAVIAGYDGSFTFERIGLEFPESVPYIALRLVSSLYSYYLHHEKCFFLALLIDFSAGNLRRCR